MKLLKKSLLILCLISLSTLVAGALDSGAVQVEGNNAFAFDLYQAVRGETGNLIFSPFSISQALAMTYGGARGETESQMAATLHFTLPQDQLHPAFGGLTDSFNERAQSPIDPESEGQRLQLNIANALWGQQGFPFRQDYLDLMNANYEAGLQQVDFAADPEGARQQVNQWVADQTEDRIQNIVPENAFNALTRLVLANAIYFNASWFEPFDEADTQDDVFYLLDGSTVTVPMMTQEEGYRYFAGEGYQVAEIPYFGGDMAMLIFLPDSGNFEAFEAQFSQETFNTAVAGLVYGSDVRLTLPRFETEFSLSLADILIEMGMPAAFDPNSADFSGMADLIDERLFISDVLHKAFIKVDESGTEAAAATVVIMETAMMPMPEEAIDFRVDRPFVYVIYDNLTGSILFMGRVLNPAG
ncbi:MAG: serpin family protein [Anaerolineae bacterium]|nr:serpin family protein [Anaerolineae bacterium]